MSQAAGRVALTVVTSVARLGPVVASAMYVPEMFVHVPDEPMRYWALTC